MVSENVFLDRSILVVEDDDISREILITRLKKKLSVVYEAEDGQKGFDIFNTYHPDIILTDISLPVMDGIKLIENIKNIDKNQYIIVMTGYTEFNILEKLISLGINYFIVKPVSIEELMKIIDKIDAQIKLEQDLRIKTEKIIYELKLAKKLQRFFIPENYSDENITFAGNYISLEELGGDYYDFIKLDKNRYFFSIADVSGHGVTAALITGIAKTLFKTYSANFFDSPNYLMEIVNNQLNSIIGDTNYYLTGICAFIDTENKVVNYSIAAHPPFFHIKKSGLWETLPEGSKGKLLGIFKDTKYNKYQINIESNDRLVFYTDGIIEARNKNKEFFDIEGLRKVILESYFNKMDPYHTKDFIIDKVIEFTNRNVFDDDLTLCIIDIN